MAESGEAEEHFFWGPTITFIVTYFIETVIQEFRRHEYLCKKFLHIHQERMDKKNLVHS